VPDMRVRVERSPEQKAEAVSKLQADGLGRKTQKPASRRKDRPDSGIGVDPGEAGLADNGHEKAVKTCRSCEGTLRVVKGKLVCMVIGCPDEGYAQGIA
jgi:hypothetical protein